MKKPFVLFTVLLSLSVFSCGEKRNIPNNVEFELSDHTITDFHSELQNQFLNSDDPTSFFNSDKSTETLDLPNDYKLEFKETNDTGDSADYYEIELTKDTNSYHLISSNMSFDLYNLESGTYTYKIYSYHAGKEFVSDTKNITVNSDAPRNVYIDGVINCRDLGGWNIGENKTFKQGMIYRTGQYNYSSTKIDPVVSKPTEKGLKTVKEELKIKTDLDVRRNDEIVSITSSPLGESVNYVHTPMYFGNRNIFTDEDNHRSIRTFFNTLADINNYPVAFHCVRGTDRTGALAYAIGALVGMSEEDLIKDYLFSNFASIGTRVTYSGISGSNFYVQGIRNSEGSTLSEKAKNYLISNVGVSETTLDTIIDILVD